MPSLLHPARSVSAALGAVVLAIGAGVLATAASVVSAAPAVAATGHNQVVTVQTSSPTATTGHIDLWQRTAGGALQHVWGPAPAFVGELGVGATRDNVARTPAGTFSLTQAFGNQPNNGTTMPYFQATRADWWDGEDASPNYNKHVHQAASPGPNSENLFTAGAVYAHAVVINYNMSPVRPGLGSAFFLHVSNGQPTAGCVSTPSPLLDQIMHWLRPSQSPVITIGVGSAALAYVNSQNVIAAAHNPIGSLDVVRSSAAGTITVAGWAVDPDRRGGPAQVELFLDRRRVRVVQTSVPRPDVAAHYHVGPDQGFQTTLSAPRGRHQVCAYADNVGMGTRNPGLRCVTLAVS